MTMTATHTSRDRPLPPLRFEPILARTGLAMLLSLLVTLPAFLLDDRVLHGENV